MILRKPSRSPRYENGVTPEELSEIIFHLTFYAGWPAAVNAGGFAAEAFEERGIPLGQESWCA